MAALGGVDEIQMSKLNSVEMYTTYKHGGALKSKKSRKERELEKAMAAASNQEEKKGDDETGCDEEADGKAANVDNETGCDEEAEGKAANVDDGVGDDEVGCDEEEEPDTEEYKSRHAKWMAKRAESELREENQRIKSAVTEEIKADEEFFNYKEKAAVIESKEEELELAKQFSDGSWQFECSESQIAHLRDQRLLSSSGFRRSQGCQKRLSSKIVKK